DKQRRRNEELVGDRIEQSADGRLLLPDAGEVTVEEIADARRNEDEQSQPAAGVTLEGVRDDPERDGDQAEGGKQGAQREGARPSAPLARLARRGVDHPKGRPARGAAATAPNVGCAGRSYNAGPIPPDKFRRAAAAVISRAEDYGACS